MEEKKERKLKKKFQRKRMSTKILTKTKKVKILNRKIIFRWKGKKFCDALSMSIELKKIVMKLALTDFVAAINKLHGA